MNQTKKQSYVIVSDSKGNEVSNESLDMMIHNKSRNMKIINRLISANGGNTNDRVLQDTHSSINAQSSKFDLPIENIRIGLEYETGSNTTNIYTVTYINLAGDELQENVTMNGTNKVYLNGGVGCGIHINDIKLFSGDPVSDKIRTFTFLNGSETPVRWQGKYFNNRYHSSIYIVPNGKRMTVLRASTVSYSHNQYKNIALWYVPQYIQGKKEHKQIAFTQQYSSSTLLNIDLYNQNSTRYYTFEAGDMIYLCSNRTANTTLSYCVFDA